MKNGRSWDNFCVAVKLLTTCIVQPHSCKYIVTKELNWKEQDILSHSVTTLYVATVRGSNMHNLQA